MMQPSKIPLEKITTKGINELMQCVLMSDATHKETHSTFTDMDIDNYSTKQKPFALKSKKNYDKVVAYCNSKGFMEY